MDSFEMPASAFKADAKQTDERIKALERRIARLESMFFEKFKNDFNRERGNS